MSTTIKSFLLFAIAALMVLPAPAFARGYRGPSQGQIKQMQAYQKQMQKEYEMAVKAEQAEQKAFMDKFDTDHDGQINGKEKGPAEKFLRERRLGKAGLILAGMNAIDGADFNAFLVLRAVGGDDVSHAV